MGVFDARTATPRAVADPRSDQRLPPVGGLSLGAITSPTALGGTNGVDVKTVLGDQFQQMNGSMVQNFTGNVTTTVTRNEKHNVMGNKIHQITGDLNDTVVGKKTLTVIGPQNSLNISPKNDVHIQTHNRTHSAPEHQDEPSKKVHILGEEFEHKKRESLIVDTSMEIKGLSNEYVGWANEVVFATCEIKVLELAVAGLVAEVKVAGIDLEVFESKAHGAEAKVAGGSVAVVPAVNAVPHPPLTGGQ